MYVDAGEGPQYSGTGYCVIRLLPPSLIKVLVVYAYCLCSVQAHSFRGGRIDSQASILQGQAATLHAMVIVRRLVAVPRIRVHVIVGFNDSPVDALNSLTSMIRFKASDPTNSLMILFFSASSFSKLERSIGK
jgi:hypothetical protein